MKSKARILNLRMASAIALCQFVPLARAEAEAGTQRDAQAATSPHRAAVIDNPEVPQGHWAYGVFRALAQAEVIPWAGDTNVRPLNRYEFAVWIARISDQAWQAGLPPELEVSSQPVPFNTQLQRFIEQKLKGSTSNHDPALLMAGIIALRAEFAHELENIRVSYHSDTGEGSTKQPPRSTYSPSILYRRGYFPHSTPNSTPDQDSKE